MDIKASDLRIGNLFIGYNGLEFEWGLFHFELMKRRIEIDEIIHKGVPLTEELLLRFGFVKYGKLHDSYKLNPFIIELGILGDKYNFRKIISKEESILLKEMKYVHELQNIYYILKNKELELKNPPVKDQEG